MAPPTVYQCPSCELRFATRNELLDHVAVDHPAPVEDDLPPRRDARGLVTVPVDPGRPPGPALATAVALAAAAGCAIGVVAAPVPGIPDPSPYLAARHRELARAGVVTVPPRVLAGDPADAVVADARASGTSLLCMATRARGWLAEPLLGSVAAGVVHRSPVPVVLVGPSVRHPGARPRRMVVGIDGSDVAAAARRAASVLASRLGTPVELVRVAGTDGPVAPGTVDEGDGVVVLRGRHPARALAERAGPGGDVLVVVGSRRRTGLDRPGMGGVATGVARRASGPVMVVPADAQLDLDAPVVAGEETSPRGATAARRGVDASGEVAR